MTMIKVHHGYENIAIANPVVTLGIFDGVHKGHRAIIAKLVGKAKEMGGESVIITFEPHPRQILSGEAETFSFLTSFEEKRDMLGECGIDNIVVIKFDRKFSSIDACDFVERILIGKTGARYLIVGFNHHFGKSGQGDFETVRRCASNYGLPVERVEPLIIDGREVSSSNIRNALAAGRLEEANELLGYSYFMNGKIVPGRQIGREIGYPTANIKPDFDQKLIPKDGVYAVKVTVSGKRYPGVMSIGFNPTVEESPLKRTIEVNIIGFDREIYGSAVCVEFRYRLRDELKFNTLEELARQIGIDREMALKLLS